MRLQPRLNRCVLSIEVRQVRHQILDHGHMRQWIDLDLAVYLTPRRNTCQGIFSIDVHRAGAADPLSARTAERERRVDLVFYLEERIEHHGRAMTRIDIVGIQPGVLAAFRIIAIDRKTLDTLASGWRGIRLTASDAGVRG